MTERPALESLAAIAGGCQPPASTGIAPVVAAIRDRWGDSVRAVIYYGSCLRSGNPYTGLVDCYVIVDGYRSAHHSALAALANAVLPPNVYYLETTSPAGTQRCKYAVLSLAQLEAGARGWFQSGVWGRFAQPAALVHAADEAVALRVRAACGAAVVTLLERALPVVSARALTPADAFGRALAMSYASELRVEKATRAGRIAAADAAEYARRLMQARALLSFATVIDAHGHLWLDIDDRRRRGEQRRWRLRRLHGRLLSVLRLIKACFTFSQAVDYAAWKIERHTHVAITVTPRLRRHPLIFGWAVLWQLYRRRLVR